MFLLKSRKQDRGFQLLRAMIELRPVVADGSSYFVEFCFPALRDRAKLMPPLHVQKTGINAGPFGGQVCHS